MKINVGKIIGMTILYVLLFAVILSGVYFGISLYKDLTSSSYIEGSIDAENVFFQKDFTYADIGAQLTISSDGKKYEYVGSTIPSTDFDGRKTYDVYFNGEKTQLKTTFRSISGEISLRFLDAEKAEILTAAISVYVEFTDKQTNITLSVATDREMKFVNSYLTNNGLSMEAKRSIKNEKSK